MPQAESLYGIQHGSDNGFQSYPDYLDLRDRNHSFDGLAAFTFARAGLDTGNNPSATWLNETSGNYFDALHIRPYLGRVYHSSDEHGPNSAPYIVLTYAYWHTNFQNDRGVVGGVVQLNKHPFTILGVAPPAFHGTLLFFYPDFFVPIVNHEQVDPGYDLNTRGIRWIFEAVGLVRSLYGNYGFDLRNTMVASADLSMAGYRGDKVPAMQKRMRDAVATIPRVESAGLADNVPLAAGSNESIVFSFSVMSRCRLPNATLAASSV